MQVSEAPVEAASAQRSRSLIDLWRFRQAVVQLQPDVIFFPAAYSFFPVPSDIPALVTGRCYGAMSSLELSLVARWLRVAAAPLLPFVLLGRWSRRFWARGRYRAS